MLDKMGLLRWRDRGKPTGEDRFVPTEPPPPYEREEWLDDVVSEPGIR